MAKLIDLTTPCLLERLRRGIQRSRPLKRALATHVALLKYVRAGVERRLEKAQARPAQEKPHAPQAPPSPESQ